MLNYKQRVFSFTHKLYTGIHTHETRNVIFIKFERLCLDKEKENDWTTNDRMIFMEPIIISKFVERQRLC